MEKRKRSVSLSFVLLRFACTMFLSMFFCLVLWLATQTLLQHRGFIYHGSVPNQQVEEFLRDHPDTFTEPDDDFLSSYALFDANGMLRKSNANERELAYLTESYKTQTHDQNVKQYTYSDQSTILIHWIYQKDFSNSKLRELLPPFEVLWWITLLFAWILIFALCISWLCKTLSSKSKLFNDISNKIASHNLDFAIYPAGIREYDEALSAMDEMRQALYQSLTEQWRAQQQRDSEIAALAHDLKTPLTLIGGNTELLLCEVFPKKQTQMLNTILSNTNRAQKYLSSLLDISSGSEEPWTACDLSAIFTELSRSLKELAGSKHITLNIENHLSGSRLLQKEHFFRALHNVAQNALEHTPPQKHVSLIGNTLDTGWEFLILDEGCGFTNAALLHATERLWRDDTARQTDGHHGIGLSFTAETIKTLGGTLSLENRKHGGGVVKIFLPFKT